MTGQESVNIASDFNKKLILTGVILTKMEGDARGGAAMSVRAVTNTPIKFVGVGEKLDALEPFHPDRVASLILGMGDLLSLIERAKEQVSEEEAERMADMLQKGEFSLDDFRKQIVTLSRLGGVESLLSKIPGLGKLKKMSQFTPNNEMMRGITAMIDSMTAEERRDHTIINPSRRKRIAKGSGHTLTDVNQLLANFAEVQKVFKITSRAGGMEALQRSLMSGNLSALANLAGRANRMVPGHPGQKRR
jgi:signal recognition particle subunit SRP54